VAFKSQEKKTEMPGKDTGEIVFKEWPAKLHREPILWEVCSSYDTSYTIFKIEYPDHGNRAHDFKRKWWHDTEDKREKDTKDKSRSQTRSRRQRIASEETKESDNQEKQKKKSKNK